MKYKEYYLSRRNFIKSCLQAGVSIPLFMGALPNIAFANLPTNKRLVVVFLRGGLDSLFAVVPYADSNYQTIRDHLAVEVRDEELIAVNDFFAFHKNMKGLAECYKKKELTVIHAVATPYRNRSHFDAQDLLENGTNTPNQIKTGWLNRTIEVMGGINSSLGLSVGSSIPLMMRGKAKVSSWSPSTFHHADSDTLDRLAFIYQTDEMLENALSIAMKNSDMAQSMKGRAKKGNALFINMMNATAQFLAKPDGPRIATIDFNGFDTHSAENTKLSQLLKGLDQGIQSYRKNTPDDVWKETIIYIVSEFGRTVRPNGSKGTDHGTAGLAMVIGGNLNGGQIITKWPGLAENQLYEGRDLNPTTDLRSISKNILTSHYAIPAQVINLHILPETLNLKTAEVL